VIVDASEPDRVAAIAHYLRSRDAWRELPHVGHLADHRTWRPRRTDRVHPWRQGELWLAEAVLRGDFGREYLERSGETLDRFWRCPSIYGIRPGRYGLFTSDATSGKGIPQSSTEWTNAGFSGIVAPTSLYLYQEASGNFADSIGAFTLTASNISTYAQAVTGWSTKGWNVADDGVQRNAQSTSTSLPDLSTTSMTSLHYSIINATPTANRDFVQYGTAATSRLRITLTPRFSGVSGGNSATGTVSPTGAVRPFICKHDKTNSIARAISDQENLQPTFSTPASTKKFLVGGSTNGNNPPNSNHLYCARWDGTNSEISDANLANMQSLLGWTRSWAAAMAVGLSETNTLSESTTALVQVSIALSETDNLSEAVAAQVTETVALSETDNLSESLTAVKGYQVSLSESNSLSEALVALLTSTQGLSETDNLSEALAALHAATQGLSDSEALAEALVAAIAAAPGLSETDNLSESLVAQLAAALGVTDSEALAEALTIAKNSPVGLSDAAALAGVLAAQLVAIQGLAESETLVESMVAQLAAALGVFEVQLVTEAFHAAVHKTGDIGGTLAAARMLSGLLVIRQALGGTLTKR
jgi:hypothetical protein